jgi:hypothetical protein
MNIPRHSPGPDHLPHGMEIRHCVPLALHHPDEIRIYRQPWEGGRYPRWWPDRREIAAWSPRIHSKVFFNNSMK